MNKSSKSASMENRYPYVHSRETKKNKVIWTPDLHKKFLEAVEEIGVDEAVPKKILELMEVEGLTRDHVASHLQKYRIFLKKIADANKQVQIASEPSLLESSMIKGDGDPWKKNSSLKLNQPTPQQKNFPSYSRMHEMMNPSVLDTSSFSFPVLEASTFNTGTSSEPIHLCSLPNQGYSMQPSTILAQTIPNGLDRERELIADDPDLGVMNSVCVNSSNSSNSSFEHNLDSLMYDYCDSTTDVYPYMSIEMGSSCGLYSMSHSELVEMDSYGCNSNEVSTYSRNKMEMGIDPSNLQNVIEEDDLLLDAAYIASLWETFFPEEQYVDYESTSNNTPVTYEPPYKDMNSQILPNMVSFDSIHNGDNGNKEQHSNEQQIESVEGDVTLQTLILNSYVQD